MATVVNLGSSNIVYTTMQVGRKIKITRPLGYPSTIDDAPEEGTEATTDTEGTGGATDGGAATEAADSPTQSKTESNGFKLLTPDLGEFTDFNEAGENSVIYKHTKSGQAIIRYSGKSVLTVLFYVIAQGIIVHDHASLAMGGPAFATYFADVPTTEET